MKHSYGIKVILLISSALLLSTPSFAGRQHDSENKISPVIINQIFEKAKQNNNWKHALLTGKSAQIVLMNVTGETNPKNEIGMETHNFDQIIFIVEGHAKAILNGKESKVKVGDMIFIPQGVEHNFINLSTNKPLKIISIYSATDIPANSTYGKKSDVPPEK